MGTIKLLYIYVLDLLIKLIKTKRKYLINNNLHTPEYNDLRV